MVTALFLLLASQVPTQPVRVWLGSGQIFVQTSTDGHVVVLNARPDGRVEVLFPEDPARDPFVRAGTYEIRAPAASGPEGQGMLVAALSPDPIWFDEFVHRSEWDAASLTGAGAGADPEALLTDIVQRMLGDGSFNYDVVTYTVAPRPASIADAVSDVPPPENVCVECSFPPVEIVVSDNVPRRHFSHRRRRDAGAPVVTPPSPSPAAIAVYSVHQPLEPLPLRTPRPETVRAPRPVAPSTPRRRVPEAVPLVARARIEAAAVPRSQLLVRFVHAARSPSPALVPTDEPAPSSVAAGSARVRVAPAPPVATGGLIAAPAAAPEPRMVARPDVRPGAARAATAEATPASARAGAATGVPLGAVHTAGWRH